MAIPVHRMYSAVRAANMSGLVGRQGFSIHLRNAYSEMRAYPADNAFLILAQAFGDVATLVAELVGPTGEVVGVER